MSFNFFSLAEAFPPVSLNFAGGVSMMLKPEEYLLNISYYVSFSSNSFYKNSYLKVIMWVIAFKCNYWWWYEISVIDYYIVSEGCYYVGDCLQ